MSSSAIRLGKPTLTLPAIPTQADTQTTTVTTTSVEQLFTDLLLLVTEVSQDLITTHYNPASLTLLAFGIDADGRRLPSTAAAAADRLGWRPSWQVSNSRVLKLGQANAIGVLKGQAWRMTLFDQLLPVLPDREELTYSSRDLQTVTRGLASSLGRISDEVTVRAMVLSCMKYFDAHGTYPGTYFELFPAPPAAPNIINLGVVDPQLATRQLIKTSFGYRYELTVKLPTQATTPDTDTVWIYKPYTIQFNIPDYYTTRIKAALENPGKQTGVSLPIIRFNNKIFTADPTGKPVTDITVTLKESDPAINIPDGVYRVVGVDFGKLTTFTATTITHDPTTNTYTHDGYTYTWDCLGLTSKLLRLADENDRLAKKIYQLKQLQANNPNMAEKQRLQDKLDVLSVEKTRVNRKRKRINTELAHEAAGWSYTICQLTGSVGIFYENLSSLPIALDTETNRVLAQVPRSKMFEYINHFMTRNGILTGAVPAYGTSSVCPYCLATLEKTEDYYFKHCPGCDLRQHRDSLAAVRIAQRGDRMYVAKPVARNTTKTAPTTGSTIDTANTVKKSKTFSELYRSDKPVINRDKTGPTPKQVTKAYRKRRTLVKTQIFRKPVPFRHCRVVSDIHVPEPGSSVVVRECVQYKVNTTTTTGSSNTADGSGGVGLVSQG